MNLILIRNIYSPDTTIGDLIINNEIFCHSLEDVVRPNGAPKVDGETAIPAGRYRVMLSMSPRFGRVIPILISVPGFEGIRIHGGNTAADTEGCVIVARTIIDNKTVQGTMEKELTQMLSDNPESHFIEIINTFPYVGI
jgi:hypothetical protein